MFSFLEVEKDDEEIQIDMYEPILSHEKCNYRLQTMLREGNVFTGVCLSTGVVGMSGGGYSPPCPRRHDIIQDMVDTVRILLGCFLVCIILSISRNFGAWYCTVFFLEKALHFMNKVTCFIPIVYLTCF